jgi:hypothetical protein
MGDDFSLTVDGVASKETKPPARRPAALMASGDDESAEARGVGIGGYRLVRQEAQVAYDGIVTDTAQVFEFAQADVAEFGMAMTDVAKTIGAIVIVGIDLGEQPTAECARRKKLDDRLRIEVGAYATG